MKCIVCLGNPGSKYVKNRHNIGFCIGDFLCESFSFSSGVKKFKSTFYQGEISGESVMLIQPQTFMNLSGDAVVALLQFYKLDLDDVLVICDDFDIEFGFIRCRQQGSAGTHNGLKDIVNKCGTTSFARLRIGVGPLPELIPVRDFVLQNFDSDQELHLEVLLEQCRQAVSLFCSDGAIAVMNGFNNKKLI